MKTLQLLICIGCACGGPGKPAAPASPDPRPSAALSLEDVALRWARAALGGKRAEALSLSLSHAQLAGISNKAIAKGTYDHELTRVLDRLEGEGSAQPSAKIIGVRVARKESLPAGEKLEQPIEIAAVFLQVEEPDDRRHDSAVPMFFIRTDAGWRFTPKK